MQRANPQGTGGYSRYRGESRTGVTGNAAVPYRYLALQLGCADDHDQRT